MNAGHTRRMSSATLLILTCLLILLLWWSALFFHRLKLTAEVGSKSWSLGFFLPLAFPLMALMFAGTGLLTHFESLPPPMMVFLLFLLFLTFAISRTPIVQAVTKSLRIETLILFQGFRILPEIVIALAVDEGLAPLQLSWRGWNLDLYFAVIAILVAVVLKLKPAWPRQQAPAKTLIGATQILGILSLFNIAFIALASWPSPLREMIGVFAKMKTNEWVGHFPYVLLPSCLVMAALMGHLLLAKKINSLLLD